MKNITFRIPDAASIVFSIVASILLGSIGLAQAQQYKLATLAPDGSSWMESLREAASEVERRTDGAVQIRYYPGGVMGDSDTVLRRIRLGQLHGGMFTVGELARVAPATNLYSLPFQFRDADEVAALREAFDPFILDALAENGMIAPALSNGGFAYLFSRDPLRSTDDISSSLRVWIPQGDELSRRTLERIGASAVPLSMAEVYTGLQTGTINTFASTASGAIILQWHTRARYMLDLPVLMTVGTLAFDRKAFERMSEDHRDVVRSVFADALRAQEARTDEENRQARQALVDQGIEVLDPEREAVRNWQRQAGEVLDSMLASGDMKVPGIERLRERVAELRAEVAGDTAEEGQALER